VGRKDVFHKTACEPTPFTLTSQRPASSGIIQQFWRKSLPRKSQNELGPAKAGTPNSPRKEIDCVWSPAFRRSAQRIERRSGYVFVPNGIPEPAKAGTPNNPRTAIHCVWSSAFRRSAQRIERRSGYVFVPNGIPEPAKAGTPNSPRKEIDCVWSSAFRRSAQWIERRSGYVFVPNVIPKPAKAGTPNNPRKEIDCVWSSAFRRSSRNPKQTENCRELLGSGGNTDTRSSHSTPKRGHPTL